MNSELRVDKIVRTSACIFACVTKSATALDRGPITVKMKRQRKEASSGIPESSFIATDMGREMKGQSPTSLRPHQIVSGISDVRLHLSQPVH